MSNADQSDANKTQVNPNVTRNTGRLRELSEAVTVAPDSPALHPNPKPRRKAPASANLTWLVSLVMIAFCGALAVLVAFWLNRPDKSADAKATETTSTLDTATPPLQASASPLPRQTTYAEFLISYEETVFSLYFIDTGIENVDLSELNFSALQDNNTQRFWLSEVLGKDLLREFPAGTCLQLYYGRTPTESECEQAKTFQKRISETQAFWREHQVGFKVFLGDQSGTICSTSANEGCRWSWPLE